MKRAVFLDRDGTINEEKDYLHRIEDFALIPGAVEALRRLQQAGFFLVVVTNQSGVARGYFDLSAVEQLHRHLEESLARDGARIDAFYLCPHHPQHGIGAYRINCDCRKGRPGMLLQAARDHDIDLAGSFMIGDKLSDVEAGEAAGCRSLLVLTGYGSEEQKKVAPEVPRFPSLLAAAEYILTVEQEGGC